MAEHWGMVNGSIINGQIKHTECNQKPKFNKLNTETILNKQNLKILLLFEVRLNLHQLSNCTF
jgi:hypothetical protein